MTLDEAEIQVLANLFGAETENQPVDRASVEERRQSYWIYLGDWSNVFSNLVDKGLIASNDEGYRLRASGRPLARAYCEERPDYYWYYYHQFYDATNASEAHSRFCERLFDLDLCQVSLCFTAPMKSSNSSPMTEYRQNW